jgi:hypothetical protein
MPDYPEAVRILMKLANEGWGSESLPSLIPFPRRNEAVEIQERDVEAAHLFRLGGLEETAEYNMREAKRLIALYTKRARGEGLEAQLKNFLDAQEIVGRMTQANRARQTFNAKVGQPSNLDLPFPLD